MTARDTNVLKHAAMAEICAVGEERLGRFSPHSLSSVVAVGEPRGDHGTLKPPNGLLNPDP